MMDSEESRERLTAAYLDAAIMRSLKNRARYYKQRFWLEKDPEDLVQAAFRRACGALKAGVVLYNIEHAHRHLYKQLTRAALDSLRDKKGLPVDKAHEMSDLFLEGIEAPTADLNARLNEYIRTLPADKQLMFNLTIEGFSQTEISDRVGKSEGGYSLHSGDLYRLWFAPTAAHLTMDLYGTGSTATACCTSR